MIKAQPHFFAVAFIDDDFQPMREKLVSLLEERTERWAEVFEKVFSMAEDVRVIAEDYDLLDEPVIRDGPDGFETIRELAAQGSYSRYRELQGGQLTHWVKKVPNLVQDTLQKTVEEQYDAIREYNRELKRKVVARRNRWARIWGVPWEGAGLVLCVLLVIMRQPVLGAFFTFILWTLIGHLLLKHLERKYEERVKDHKRDSGSLRMVESEARKIGWLKSDMLILLERESDEESLY
ncbi:MAG: hypothetical protein MAG453_02040 [Calditrichaeota bacterium]|nr:hypothetical protein [Calditrichota bacterium]